MMLDAKACLLNVILLWTEIQFILTHDIYVSFGLIFIYTLEYAVFPGP